MGTPGTDDSVSSRGAAPWRRTRLCLVLLALAGYAAASMTFYRECAVVETTNKASQVVKTVTTCSAPSVSSGTLLVLLLLAVLLLWPEISEVSVLGVTLKRRVEVAEREAAGAKDDARALAGVVQTMQVQVNAAVANSAAAVASSNTTVHVWGKGDAEDLSTLAAEAVRLHEAQAAVEDVPREKFQDGDWLAGKVVRNWETLRDRLRLDARMGVRIKEAVEDGPVTPRKQAFIEDHWDSLIALRKLRNAVAHSLDVPLEDMQQGVTLSSDLLQRLDDWLAD